ncbi:SMR family transporter [Hylemonella sp. W303a]|uniref:SMR family transporter n=1 Tax=Hylemonella sp. W303a TaxID=3389873 RepID=UPI00396B0517
MKPWLMLSIAILSEVVATSALNASAGFRRFWPALITVVGYGFSFYFLAQVLRHIPVGITYAVWCGAGIVLISLIGWVVFKQRLDTPALIGIGLILAGVLVLNVFSKSTVR